MQVGEDPDHVLVAITLKHFVANAVEGSWTPEGAWGGGGKVNRHTVDAKISKHDLQVTKLPCVHRILVYNTMEYRMYTAEE